MPRWLRYALAGICLVGLAVVRFRESVLFYDPLIDFFHGIYEQSPLPEMQFLKFYGHTIYRFLMNTLLSLTIIHLLFAERGILKMAAVLYGVFFVVSFILLLVSVQMYEPGEYMLLFYSRRFLIQPLLLFVLVPAFYYHKKVAKS